MKQIRLDEMTDRRKVQYAQMKKKKGLKKSYFLVYGIFILYLIALTLTFYYTIKP